MGLFKSLKKLKLKDVAKVAKTAAGFIPGVGTIVKVGIAAAEGIAKTAAKVKDKANELSRLGGAVQAGSSAFSNELADATAPPKRNWILLAVFVFLAWFIFSPNPGIMYSIFGAGTVTTRVGRRRKNPATKRRSAVTEVSIKTGSTRKRKTRKRRGGATAKQLAALARGRKTAAANRAKKHSRKRR